MNTNKLIQYGVSLLLLLGSMACNDFLDKKPKDIISDEDVWNKPSAIEAYLVNLYYTLPSEDFNYQVIDEAGYPSQITDEAVRSYTWGAMNNPIIPDAASPWWGYVEIRNVNDFLQKIDQTTIPEKDKITYKAEARFIRAFYYFALVKRYGGVPLITIPQKYTGNNLEALQVPRNTEKEIDDFIRTELDEIIPLLPESYGDASRYRATRYAALALKSRAMLYAASIASYGLVELGGLVGIPSNEKDFYWNESKKASEAIINSGKFALYRQNGDPSENFQNLFLDQSLHSEAIFMEVFKAPEKGHSFDFYNAPQSFKFDYGNVTNPALDLVEDYENRDGSPGNLPINDATGTAILYANPQDLFAQKDPRMRATMMSPFDAWQGGVFEVRRGIILEDGSRLTSSNLTDVYGVGSNQITITGKDGILTATDVTKTGFCIKKFMDPVNRLNANYSETPWMVFRYAEILLNYAEACAELNSDLDAGLAALNDVRNRAGISEYASASDLSIEHVRQERKVELAFENHRLWDIRRWRIATDVLSNKRFDALYPWLVWEEGKNPADMKYLFEIVPSSKNTRTFLSKQYYEPISREEISANPNLVQNPGY